MGAAISALLYPVFTFLLRRKISRAWAGALCTAAVTLVFLVPIALLSIQGIKAGIQLVRAKVESPFSDAPGGGGLGHTLAQIPWVGKILDRLGDLFFVDTEEVLSNLTSIGKSAGVKLVALMGDTLTSLPTIGVGFFLLILSIYFFLVDGERLSRYLRRMSFFPETQTELLFGSFAELCRSVLLASVVSGICQALVFLIGLVTSGSDNLALYTLIVFFASFVPIVGAAPFTFGFALYTLFTDPGKGPGIALLVAAGVAAVVDNIVRPIVLKGGANLHPLMALLGLFGGLALFGFSGVFIGPVIVGMFVVSVECTLRAAGK
jgi:predicted PurR-regulated permease PerM